MLGLSHLGTTGRAGIACAGALIAAVAAGGAADEAAESVVYLPAAAHVAGAAGTVWRTDVELHNPTDATITVKIEPLRHGQANPMPFNRSFDVQAGACLRLEDVLHDQLGLSETASLRLTTTGGEVVASARTYNWTPSGTFGQWIAPVGDADAVGGGENGRLTGLHHQPSSGHGFRTNLGLVNTTSSSCEAHVRLLARDGAVLGEVVEPLGAYEYVQLNRVFERVTSASVRNGWAVVWPSAGGAELLAYASVVDNQTGDPVYVPAVVVQGSFAGATADPGPEGAVTFHGERVEPRIAVSQELMVAGCAHVRGAAGTDWRTDLVIHNPEPDGQMVALHAVSEGSRTSVGTMASLLVAPGASMEISDVLWSMFALNGAATVRVQPDGNRDLLVGARTYNLTEHGTYGQLVPGMWTSEAIGGTHEGRLIQLSHQPGGGSAFRTNLGLVSTTSVDCDISVALYAANGAELGTFVEPVAAGGYVQIDRVFERVTSAAVDDGYAVLHSDSAGAAFLAYASVVDNRTGDPIYIPAVVRSREGSGGDLEASLVMDIRPGATGAFTRDDSEARADFVEPCVAAGKLFFAANDGVHGFELWISDGTASGTRMVRDINPGGDHAFPGSKDATWFSQTLTAVGDLVFFVANDGVHDYQLWRSDGTEAGTAMVVQLDHGGHSWPRRLTAAGDALFFAGHDGTFGWGLWRSDGSTAGTHQVIDLNPEELAAFSNLVVFRAEDDEHGEELWRSDGTGGGTWVVKDIEPGPGGSYPRRFVEALGRLFFRACQAEIDCELWISDLTEAGTSKVHDIAPGERGSFPDSLTEVGSWLFFAASDDTIGVNHGEELWKTDGTEAGTVLVKDIWPGYDDSNPAWLTASGSLLFFKANTADQGVWCGELWTSDGTEAGTGMVADIYPENSGCINLWPRPIVADGYGGALFAMTDGTHGWELWRSDGTESGTVMVRDILQGADGSRPDQLITSGGKLFFRADDGAHGPELWVVQ
jgi:ELWxxDGT repeat protein